MDTVLRLSDPWAYVVVGLLAMAETMAFVGLFAPGETALVAGGFLAFSGRADLGWMLVAAILGAISGDSGGYLLGRTLGPRLRSSRLGRSLGEERWRHATDYVRRKGGRAIFFGRWIGILRAVVPPVVGASGYPYGRFLVWDVPAAAAWASAFVLLGYFAGEAWRAVGRWAGRAGLLVAVLALLALALVFLRRRKLHPPRSP